MADLIGIFKKLGKLKDLRTNKKTDLVSSINEVNDKANSSVSSVEAGLNYNTIKITKNDGTTENILIKVQGGSDSINVFKTAQHGGSFIATEGTNSFVIEGIDSTKDVQVIYKNFFLVPNVDYTVDKETGEVGLGFTLEKDEVIYYLITDTSFDYNELNNLPNIGNIEGLNTSSKEIVSGINEVLEKEKSNEEQINVLKNDRGYVSPKNISSLDLNLITENGKYWGRLMSNMPPGVNSNLTCVVDVTRIGESLWHVRQVLRCDVGIFERWKTEYWQPWQQIATTSTWTATSDNLNNGWVAWGKTYYPVFTKIGDLVTVNNGFLVNGTVAPGTVIMSDIPTEFIPSKQRIATVANTSNTTPCVLIKTDGTFVIDTTYGITWSAGIYDFSFTYKL